MRSPSRARFPSIARTRSPKTRKSRIFCWKDKTGKTVGCGDKVPPEYQDSATREMDARGVTRGTTESAEEAARRLAQEQETARRKRKEEITRRYAEHRKRYLELRGEAPAPRPASAKQAGTK